MASCIICYEDKDLLLNNCKYNCIFNIHQRCLDKMKEISNIDCPICRNKIYKINFINYNHNYNYTSFDLLFFLRMLILGLLIILFIFSMWIITILKFIFKILFKLFQFFF
jgi:hypothetical protein